MNINAGIGDPYFYEWTVGLEKTISLMIPEKKLKSVTIQSTSAGSLDDVVCEYLDIIEYIQVKHTRNDTPLGFSFLISSSKDGISLLNKIAKSWNKLRNSNKKVQAVLLTNKRLVDNTTSISRGDSNVQLPKMSEFWNWFEEAIGDCITLSELFEKTPENWILAVQIIFEEADVFDGDDELLLEFFHNFSLKYEYPNTNELDQSILNQLGILFSIPEESSVELYQKLFFALKDWASSNRQKEKITVEDVFTKLAVFDVQYPEFQLLPPEPFFESRKALVAKVEDICKNGQQRIIFIYGKPGIGKTSLINYLSQKINSVIDLRYYAYIPITPDSISVNLDSEKSTSEEKLWGSLLNQIRGLFVGKLYEYEVPIKNSFLNTFQMRDHVLRLASEYGELHGKKTIIVIDGIDHAARSGKRENFLNSLVPPENIPNNVIFIICGQAAEDYPNYPIWLSKKNLLLEKIEVKGIWKSDIKDLLEKINPSVQDIDLFSNIIYDFSEGNTLSAIFSAYETISIDSVGDLIPLLEVRNLNSNITEYYDQIWESRALHYDKDKEVGNSILAGLFVIVKEKLDINDFCEIFDDLLLTKEEWKEILKSYSPLIVEQNNKYFLYHNDIRVYLEDKIRHEKTELKSISSKLADFYLRSKNKKLMRHTDIFRLLDMSDRSEEKMKIFNTDYLKEAFEIGQNNDVIINQLKEVCLVLDGNFNLDELIDLSIISMELTQYVKVFERYDIEQEKDRREYFVSEYQKINLNHLNLSNLKKILLEINELYLLGEEERVVRTFKKWFTDVKKIFSSAFNNSVKENGGKIKIATVVNVIEQVTYFSVLFSVEIDLSFFEKKPEHKSALFWGRIRGAVETDDITSFLSLISRCEDQVMKELNKLLDFLFDNKKYNWIKKLTTNLSESYEYDIITKINLAFIELVIRGHIGEQRFEDWFESNEAEKVFLENYENIVFILCKGSFLMGYSSDIKLKYKLIDRLVSLYYLIRRDDRGKNSIEELLSIFYDLGKMNLQTKNLEFIEIKNLLQRTWDISRLLFLSGDANESKSFIEWYLIFYVDMKSERELNFEMTQYLIELTKNKKRYQDSFIRNIWDYLYSRGYDQILIDYYDLWLGEHGLAWNESIQDMLTSYDLFTGLVINLENGNNYVEDALLKRRHYLLGFVEHKEDILNYPYSVFKKISQFDPSQWSERGLSLMNLSERVSKKGHNLLSDWITEIVIESSIESGYDQFYNLVSCNTFGEIIIQKIGFISSLIKNKVVLKNDQVAYWFLLEAIADKYVESDKEAIIKYLSNILENQDEMIRVILETRLDEVQESFEEKESKTDLVKLKETDAQSILSLFQMIEVLSETGHNERNSQFDYKKMYLAALNKLISDRNQHFRDNRETLFSIFLNLDNGFSWESQGMEEIIPTLFEVLSQQQRKKLFSHILNNRYLSSNSSYWLSSFSSDLNLYVIEVLYSTDIELLYSYFDKQIEEIKTWDNNYRNTYELMCTELSSSSWSDVVKKIIWVHFSTDSITKTAEVFRGVYFMYLVFPDNWDNNFAIRKTMVRQKYLLLLLLEELTKNGIDISFADDFIEFCFNDSKQFLLKAAACIVKYFKNKDISLLEQKYSGDYIKSSDLLINGDSDYVTYMLKKMDISPRVDIDDVIEIYNEEYIKPVEVIKNEIYVGWKYRQDDRHDYIDERHLNDELYGRGLLNYTVLRALPIDDPSIMLEFSQKIEYDERFFTLNFDKTDDVIYFKQIINNLLEPQEISLGYSWAKPTEKEEELKFLSYSLADAALDIDYNSFSIGKIIGRGSLMMDLKYYEGEDNHFYSLFDIVYGSTIYMKSYRIVPSEMCIELIKNYNLILERKTFYMLNKEWYIDSKKYQNLSIEVWTTDKETLNKLMDKYQLKLIEIAEQY